MRRRLLSRRTTSRPVCVFHFSYRYASCTETLTKVIFFNFTGSKELIKKIIIIIPPTTIITCGFISSYISYGRHKCAKSYRRRENVSRHPRVTDVRMDACDRLEMRSFYDLFDPGEQKKAAWLCVRGIQRPGQHCNVFFEVRNWHTSARVFVPPRDFSKPFLHKLFSCTHL